MFCAKMGGVDSGRTPAGRSGMQSGKRNLTLGSVNKELQPLALCAKSFIHWHSLYKECFHKNDKYHYQTIPWDYLFWISKLIDLIENIRLVKSPN